MFGDYTDDMVIDTKLDPCLQSLYLPSSSDFEYFSQKDFNLLTDDWAFENIQPALLVNTTPLSQPLPPTPSSSTPSSSASSSSSAAASPSHYSDDSTSSINSPKFRGAKRRPSHVNAQDHTNPKRHQTKLACNWCRKLSKKCDTQRPCGRCIQYNRCSECMDAPPRKPRGKGFLRGSYKKTEGPGKEYREDIDRSEYIARQPKPERKVEKGKEIGVELTSDELLKREIILETSHQMLKESSMVEEETLQNGSVPFSGPLEDLFTCVESPLVEEHIFPTSSFEEFLSAQTDTPVEASVTDPSSATDQDELDLVSWQMDAMDMYPDIMELFDTKNAAATSFSFRHNSVCHWTDFGIEV